MERVGFAIRRDLPRFRKFRHQFELAVIVDELIEDIRSDVILDLAVHPHRIERRWVPADFIQRVTTAVFLSALGGAHGLLRVVAAGNEKNGEYEYRSRSNHSCKNTADSESDSQIFIKKPCNSGLREENVVSLLWN